MIERPMHIDAASFIDILRADTQTSIPVGIAELVDNSLDWGARAVDIDISEHGIRISDDGRGCQDLQRLIDVDRGKIEARGRIGRYGWGVKYTAMLLANRMQAASRCDGILRTVAIDYASISSGQNIAQFSDPRPEPGPSFMQIDLLDLRFAKRHLTNALSKDFARRYQPALRAGLRLTINGEAVVPLPLPKLDRSVKAMEQTFNGLGYRVLAFGAVRKDQGDLMKRWRTGWHVAYHGRILNDRGIDSGFGDYIDPSVFGIVELFDDGAKRWTVDPKKVGFAESDDLLESLYPYIAATLAFADQRAQDSQLAQIAHQVASLLSGRAPLPARATREKGDKVGTVTELHTARKQHVASNATTSPDAPPLDTGGEPIVLRFTSEIDNFVECSGNKRRIIVRFNQNHPLFLQQPDIKSDARALALLCAQAIAYEATWGTRGVLHLLPFVKYVERNDMHQHPENEPVIFERLMQQIAQATSEDRKSTER